MRNPRYPPRYAPSRYDLDPLWPRPTTISVQIIRMVVVVMVALLLALALFAAYVAITSPRLAHAESAAAVVRTYWVGSGQNEPVWTLTRITNFLTTSPEPGTIYGIMVWEDQGNHDLVVRGFRFDNALAIVSERRIPPGTKLSLSYGIYFLPGGLPIQMSVAFWWHDEGWKASTLLPDWEPDRTIVVLEDSTIAG